jgi:hypothetical protein
MSMNQNIDANHFFKIIDKCMKFLAKKDKDNFDGRMKDEDRKPMVKKDAH